MIRTLPSQKVLNDRTLTVFALLLLRLLLVSMGIILRRSVENIEVPVSRITDFEFLLAIPPIPHDQELRPHP